LEYQVMSFLSPARLIKSVRVGCISPLVFVVEWSGDTGAQNKDAIVYLNWHIALFCFRCSWSLLGTRRSRHFFRSGVKRLHVWWNIGFRLLTLCQI
jgi:hypothetical protein